ncbi:DNA polymerase III subunit gamma/tau [uncultured Campylobacter sp.]|uniref:DNA polymerase III subunit gamma/tau n=1 Tax=uncultured Campylobacter sp. TaxID=218934 RepID=UPI002629075A|nr:DNA polymerase III subunit gamma/tau [uncultured Campylobacter sp.]
MQPLALKYRPKDFSELIGQDVIAKSLSHSLDTKRVANAYLFSGLRGSGKTSSARIFAKALICENGPTSKPCQVCQNCIMANENRHMDIVEIDGASHRKIDDIRELIENVKYAPTMARYKVFIVDEVHMLTKEAFNAFLKTLEEPPSYVKFILATTDPLKLPATILSRTQHFRFLPISKSAIVGQLEFILKNENIPYEKEALEILSRSGSGSLRDTITLLDQAIVYAEGKITAKNVAAMLGLLDPKKIEEILDVIILKDKNRAIELIKELENQDADSIIDEISSYLKEAFLNKNPKFSLLMYERFFRILSEAKSLLSLNSDGSFVLSILFFMMMEATSLKNIDELIEEKTIEAPAREVQTRATTAKFQTDVVQKKEPNNKDKSFENFLKSIYDRSFELGECFDRNVKFISFKDGVLLLSSLAKGEDQTLLRASSRAILSVLKECYGESAKIKIEQSKEKIEPKQNIDEILDIVEAIAPEDKKQDIDNSQLIERVKNSTSSKSKDESIMDELSKFFGEPQITNKNS